MTTTYQVNAYQDGKWWTFEIPGLTSPSPRGGDHRIIATGQAARASEVAREARELAALWTDVDMDVVAVDVVYQLPEAVGAAMNHARQLDEKGRAALEEAAVLRRRAVHELRASSISQTDAALLLGLSRQRVQQLEAAS